MNTQSQKTILLVEDEALIAMNEAAILQKNGYNVITAYNAQKAIEAAKEQNIGLILMDIDLGKGKMDGTEAAEIILRDRDIPIVFLSSHTEPEIVEKTEGITSYGYIVKNSGETVLLASLKMAFRLFDAEQDIEKSENKYRNLFENMTEEVHIWELVRDNQGDIKTWKLVDANTSALKSWAKTRTEAIDKTPDEIWPNSGATEQFMPIVKKIFEEGRPHTWESYFAGTDQTLQMISAPLGDFFFSTGMDITERKKSEKALVSEKMLLNTVLDNIKEAIIICNEKSEIIRFNEAARRLHNLPEKPIPVEQWAEYYDLYYPDGETLLATEDIPLFRALNDEDLVNVEIVVAPKNGEPHILSCNGCQLKDNKGEVIGAVIAMHDITDRKKEEKRLKSVLNNSPFPVAVVDEKDKEIQFWSQSAMQLFGHDPRTTKEWFELAYPNPAYRQDVMKRWNAAFEQNKNSTKAFNTGEYEIHCKDGKIKICELYAQFIPGNLIVTLNDITDRKIAEEKRRKSDQRFRIAQDMSPDGFTIFKPVRDKQNRIIDFVWVYQNAAVARMNGTDPQKVVGKSFLELFPGAKETQFMKAYIQVAESGEPITFEDVYIGETMKTKAWFRIVVVPMDENIAILAHNITEEKEAEIRLKRSEKKYRSIFDNSALGIFRSTPEGKYEMVNTAFARILGFQFPEKMLNEVTDISELYKYPEDRERIKKEFAEKGFVEDYEVLANHPDNEIAWISINASQRQYPDGSFYYEGTIQDITKRKQVEEELRTSKKFFTGIVENIPTMVFMKEAKNFTFYLVNKAAEETIGMKREDLIGKSDYDIFPKHEADFFREKDLEVINRGNEVEIQEEELAASDQIRYMYTKKVPIFDEEGNPQYLLGISEDITELKEAFKEKDYLMKELNHRVKNNLNMVSSLINLKNSSLGSNIDLSDLENRINAIRLIHEKLYQTEDISRINLKEYIHDLNENVFSLSKRHVEIEEHIDDIFLSTKKAIPLGLIINEIATNAIKYGFTAEGTARFFVDLKEDKTKNQYTLKISNTGKPFPKDVTLANPDTLGLQLISALVSQLDGTIELQREPHPVFTIKFPIEEKT